MDFEQMFKDAPEAKGGSEQLPEGDYVALIDHATIDLTKKPQRLSVTYTIHTEGFRGRKVFGNYSLEGRGLGFLKKDLKTIGADYSTVKKPEDLCQIVNDKSGIAVELAVKHREYEGKTYVSTFVNGVTSVSGDKEVPW